MASLHAVSVCRRSGRRRCRGRVFRWRQRRGCRRGWVSRPERTKFQSERGTCPLLATVWLQSFSEQRIPWWVMVETERWSRQSSVTALPCRLFSKGDFGKAIYSDVDCGRSEESLSHLRRIPQSPVVTAPFRQGSHGRPMAAPTVKPRGGADKPLAGEHSSPLR